MREPIEVRASSCAGAHDFSQTRSTAGSRSGFTLIELIVVMGIIVMAASFMVPTLTSFFANRSLTNAGTLFTNVMNSARNEAVSSKKNVYVVFLKRGLRLYKTGVDPQDAWVGGEQSYEPGRDELPRITCVLEFSGYTNYDLYPTTVSDLEGGLQRITEAPAGSEGDLAPEGDIAICFRPDGTVDFGPFQDVSSYEFEAKPPRADIRLLQRQGESYSDIQGFVDIQPAGRVTFKIEDVRAEED